MARHLRRQSLTVSIANQQSECRVPTQLLRRAALEVLRGEKVRVASISLAIVDDPTIHRLNREYLQHDYPTDVLSFLLERSSDGSTLEGEIILSADTATSNAAQFGSTPQHEMALYVVHGLLHLVGFDDHSPADRRQMRNKEAEYLSRFGITDTRTVRKKRSRI